MSLSVTPRTPSPVLLTLLSSVTMTMFLLASIQLLVTVMLELLAMQVLEISLVIGP